MGIPLVTVLNRYLAAAGQPDMFEPAPVFDEFAAPDGTARLGWDALLRGLEGFAEPDLLRAQSEVARLLADDGVTYTPGPGSTQSVADDPARQRPDGPVLATARPWQLDPLPLILDEREWSALEAGMVQRAELLNAIHADLYADRDLLASRHLPVAAVLDHAEYLRPLVGAAAGTSPGLFQIAVDLGRDTDGSWRVIADRTQAPSGAGYAMQNRRVVSRVLPDVYSAAQLHRLTPFFQAMRAGLVDAAPKQVENPRVVVLSPGTHSETAYDQAFVASLLGFPLLEGSDLTVRYGRVWMRVLGKLEQVDVILRRVDSLWMDALELKGGSRLGVTGLVECVRQGTVSVVNDIGSGVLENPALLPFLPGLCERFLGEPLRLPSVDTWWCGEEDGLAYVLGHFDDLVIRPISRDQGRSVRAAALSREQRERLRASITARPHRFVGQRVLDLSVAPTSDADRLVGRPVVLRSFAVRQGSSYSAMLGGLARVSAGDSGRGVLVTPPGPGVAKDVWVVGRQPMTSLRPSASLAPRREADAGAWLRDSTLDSSVAAMVPRVLDDLFWMGRYAERAEDLLRLVLATRTVAIETNSDTGGGRPLPVLLRALTHVSTAYPGFLDESAIAGDPMPEFRSLLLDRSRTGTVAQSIAGLTRAATGVRDQLSDDVWMVLADIDRAFAALAAQPNDQGLHLADAGERVLSGLLALAGISSENMVRDAGWYMLDVGRGLERALQTVALLKATLPASELVLEAVLTATESIVTSRRRNRGRHAAASVVHLLAVDVHNPRSVAYQLERIGRDLRAIPTTSPTARPIRLADAMSEQIRQLDVSDVGAFLGDLQQQLRTLSDALRDQYHALPPPQQVWRSTWSEVS